MKRAQRWDPALVKELEQYGDHSAKRGCDQFRIHMTGIWNNFGLYFLKLKQHFLLYNYKSFKQLVIVIPNFQKFSVKKLISWYRYLLKNSRIIQLFPSYITLCGKTINSVSLSPTFFSWNQFFSNLFIKHLGWRNLLSKNFNIR